MKAQIGQLVVYKSYDDGIEFGMVRQVIGNNTPYYRIYWFSGGDLTSSMENDETIAVLLKNVEGLVAQLGEQ